MGVFKEIPPTAGYGLTLRDIIGVHQQGSLEEDFKRCLGLPYASVHYSGTAALYFILETIKQFSPKKTVILPSFICPLVTLAVIKAGLKIEICDIKLDRFDYNEAELQALCLKNQDILAVLAVHLAGIPVDIKKIAALTQQHNIFLIEDCAQALGSTYEGQQVGTFGDFSFFSLCRGKGLTIYEGGVLVTKHDKYISALKETVLQLEKKNVLSELLKIAELLGYALFYRPALFWFVFNLPQKYWMARKDPVRAWGEFSLDFDIYKVGNFRKRLGHATFSKVESEITKRRQKADFYFENLKKTGLQVIKELPNTRAVYPYVTLIIKDLSLRQKILDRLQSLGLGGSIIYLKAVNEYDHLKDSILPKETPNGHFLAGHTMILSTSAFLSRTDLAVVVEALSLANGR